MLPKHRRLHTDADFKRLRKKGKVWKSPSFIAQIAPSRRPPSRLGIIVSAKIGKSVVRKRASRILRHAFAQQFPSDTSVDIILIARPHLRYKDTGRLKEELQKMQQVLRL